jgi:hypothetical protein
MANMKVVVDVDDIVLVLVRGGGGIITVILPPIKIS